MDNNQSIDEAMEGVVSVFDDNEGRTKMSIAEELVERMPYKQESDDPLGDIF